MTNAMASFFVSIMSASYRLTRDPPFTNESYIRTIVQYNLLKEGHVVPILPITTLDINTLFTIHVYSSATF